ncbi:MAG: DsbA family protein [Acidiferrobacterales bacterium]
MNAQDLADRLVTIEHFSDVLCIWAYGAQARVDELKRNFGDQIELRNRFIPLFAATHDRIGEGWRKRGGFAGFNRHCREVAERWDHVSLHPDVWLHDIPASSTTAHVLLKAVQLLQERGQVPATAEPAFGGRTRFEEAIWRVRCAFFQHAQNIARWGVLSRVAEGLELPLPAIRQLIDSGEAYATLHLDTEAKERYYVPGSPTFILNEGRQRLYGNVGYRIIEANVTELLHNPHYGEASWC